MSKCCWLLRGVVRLRSAGISMSAPAAHIVPRSRITAAVIAIAQVSDRCSRTVDCRTWTRTAPHALPARGLHTPPPPGPSGAAEQNGDLRSLVSWLRPLVRQDWVVYLRRPFGGPQYVLQYLGRYTHRVAISNHRLVSFADGQVTFRWRDSAHHNEQKLTALSHDKFLRRFLLHLLPQGFVRIPHFGFLACRRRSTTLPLCFQLLGAAQEALSEEHTSSTEDARDLYRCPKCGGPMKVIERLTAAEIQLRSPPRINSAA